MTIQVYGREGLMPEHLEIVSEDEAGRPVKFQPIEVSTTES